MDSYFRINLFKTLHKLKLVVVYTDYDAAIHSGVTYIIEESGLAREL